jgi:hypothetical protein
LKNWFKNLSDFNRDLYVFNGRELTKGLIEMGLLENPNACYLFPGDGSKRILESLQESENGLMSQLFDESRIFPLSCYKTGFGNRRDI